MVNNNTVKKNSNKSSEGGDIGNGSSRFDYIQPIQAEPLEVRVYNNFDKALRAFRALVQKERILSTYKEKQSFEKPSDKKRRKRNEMKRKLLELDMKDDVQKDKQKEKQKDRHNSNYVDGQ